MGTYSRSMKTDAGRPPTTDQKGLGGGEVKAFPLAAPPIADAAFVEL
jgi:hypothetical protein